MKWLALLLTVVSPPNDPGIKAQGTTLGAMLNFNRNAVLSAPTTQVKPGEVVTLPQTLPIITMAGLTEQPLDIEQRAGRSVLVLFFFNEQCGVTYYYKDRIARLQRDFAPYSVQFLAVRTGQRQDPTGPLKVPEATYLQMPVVEDVDERLMRQFEIGQSVTFVVLDRQHRVAYRGGFDDQIQPKQVRNPYLRNALRDLVKNRPVSRPTAPAIGCAILPSAHD